MPPNKINGIIHSASWVSLDNGTYNNIAVSANELILNTGSPDRYKGKMILKYPISQKHLEKNSLSASDRAADSWNIVNKGYPALAQSGYRLQLTHRVVPNDDEIQAHTVYLYKKFARPHCVFRQDDGVIVRVELKSDKELCRLLSNQYLEAIPFELEHAIFQQLNLPRECWMAPYLGRIHATDEQTAKKVIDTYSELRIIIADAFVQGNFLLYKSRAHCVDMDQFYRRGADCSEILLSNAINTKKYQASCKYHFKAGKKMTVSVIETLFYLERHLDEHEIDSAHVSYVMMSHLNILRKLNLALTKDMIDSLLIATKNERHLDFKAFNLMPSQNAHVSYCIEKHPSIYSKNEQGETPLILTATSKQSNVDHVRLLIQAGSDLNAVDIKGNTALLKACALGREDIAVLLIEHGADICMRNEDNQNVVDHALKHCPQIMDKLLLSIANLNSNEQQEIFKNISNGNPAFYQDVAELMCFIKAIGFNRNLDAFEREISEARAKTYTEEVVPGLLELCRDLKQLKHELLWSNAPMSLKKNVFKTGCYHIFARTESRLPNYYWWGSVSRGLNFFTTKPSFFEAYNALKSAINEADLPKNTKEQPEYFHIRSFI